MSNQQYFFIRRLHSLLGVVPLGVFLIAHLTTNSMSAFGQDAFDHKVELIHSLGPLLPFVEALVIFIPLALHILIGIVILPTGRGNAMELSYARNWAYSLQRWTGIAAVFFIVWHTVTLRFMDVANIYAQAPGNTGYYEYLSASFQNPLFILAYLIGGGATIYHFANGLATFCMTWGITVGPKSQRVMAAIALVVGLGLMGMLLGAIAGFYFGFDDGFVPQTANTAAAMMH